MSGIASWVELIIEGLEDDGSNDMFVVMVGFWIESGAVENLHGGGFPVVIVPACYEDSYSTWR